MFACHRNHDDLNQFTVGRMSMKSTRKVLGHSLLRSIVRSHRSLIRLLRTARLARALPCTHLFVRSLAHPHAHGNEVHVYRLYVSILYSINPLWGGFRVRARTNGSSSTHSSAGHRGMPRACALMRLSARFHCARRFTIYFSFAHLAKTGRDIRHPLQRTPSS